MLIVHFKKKTDSNGKEMEKMNYTLSKSIPNLSYSLMESMQPATPIFYFNKLLEDFSREENLFE